ncbi:hypothetical protein ABH917_004302 [Thermobifida halotolerans]
MNCSAGTIAMAMTGIDSTALTTSRVRSASTGSAGRGSSLLSAFGGSGRAAVYPAFSTVAIRSSAVTPPPNSTDAFSVA